MKRNLHSFKTVFTGLLLAALIVFSSSFNANAVIKRNNDSGVAVTAPSLTIPSTGVCIINQTFNDGTLPQPAGIISKIAGTQDGRLYRDGVPSTCSLCSPFTVNSAGTSMKYEFYTFKAANTGCLNLSIQMPTENVDLYVAVYSGTYNPANFIVNGIGQGGVSGSTSFACPVVAGQTYSMVVMEVYAAGAGVPYTIALDNVQGAAVPISIWWILAAFVVIGGFTLYKFRLRRA